MKDTFTIQEIADAMTTWCTAEKENPELFASDADIKEMSIEQYIKANINISIFLF